MALELLVSLLVLLSLFLLLLLLLLFLLAGRNAVAWNGLALTRNAEKPPLTCSLIAVGITKK